MAKNICLIHSNCQGDPLKRLLDSHEEFSSEFETYLFSNFKRENIAHELLGNTSLFLYQELGQKWEDLSSQELLKSLNKKAMHYQIPNMMFKAYWPLWKSTGILDFSDIFLEYLFEQKLNLEQAMHIYLRGDLNKKYDIAKIAQDSLKIEEDKQKNCTIRTIELIKELWQTKQIFSTINHPEEDLNLHIANQVLDLLNFKPCAKQKEYPRCSYDFDLPIHPFIGKFYNLPFVSEERKYNVYGRQMTFAEYSACYYDCLLGGYRSLPAYIQAIKN